MLFYYKGLCFLVLCILLSNAYTNETKLQFYFAEVALTIPGDGRKHFRSNDPSVIVPHLFQGDRVTVDFKTHMPMNVSIDNVTYSNDGGSDRITVMLDGLEVGSFDTHSHSNWGEKWNDFFGSFEIGDWETVFPGHHTLSFKVEQSNDCFGVELGTLYATVDVHVNDQTFWQNPRYKLAERRQECITEQNMEHTAPTTTPLITSSTVPVRLSTSVFKETTESQLSSAQSFLSTNSTLITIPSTLTTTHSQLTSTSTFKPHRTKFVTASPSSSSLSALTSVSSTKPQRSRTTTVFLDQLSYKTNCIDKNNVRIKITRSGFEGTRIVARASDKINRYLATDQEHLQGKTTCGLYSWQLGKIDGDYTEFQHFVPHDIVTLKLENDEEDTAKFPAKILPFATPIIKLTFRVSRDVQLQHTSTFFVLGLVNLTKETFVGLQYNSGPMDTDFLTFTPKRHIMGWSILDLVHGTNHFYLHFDTSVNIIMFDFLKLEIRLRETRKIGVVIAESTKLRIKGILSPEKRGMIVTTDSVSPVMNVENMVFFYRPDHASQYHAVLSIKSNGAICIYHNNNYNVIPNHSKRQLSDISQFSFRREADLINYGGDISSLNFNTKSFVLTIIYKDGSILITQLTPSETSTELLVKSFYAFDKNMNPLKTQTIIFQSTHITEYLAAVNDIADGKRTRNIMGDLASLKVSDRILFRKTSPTNVFLTSELLELYFPK